MTTMTMTMTTTINNDKDDDNDEDDNGEFGNNNSFPTLHRRQLWI